jgi:hypothetical protein
MILDLDLNVIMRTWACLHQVKDRRVYNLERQAGEFNNT